MKEEDKELLKVYMFGFNSELNFRKHENPFINGSFLFRSYELGVSHALLGDDNRSFDKLSDEEILKIIKG